MRAWKWQPSGSFNMRTVTGTQLNFATLDSVIYVPIGFQFPVPSWAGFVNDIGISANGWVALGPTSEPTPAPPIPDRPLSDATFQDTTFVAFWWTDLQAMPDGARGVWFET